MTPLCGVSLHGGDNSYRRDNSTRSLGVAAFQGPPVSFQGVPGPDRGRGHVCIFPLDLHTTFAFSF